MFKILIQLIFRRELYLLNNYQMSANGSNPHSLQKNSFNNLPTESGVHAYSSQYCDPARVIHLPNNTTLSVNRNPETQQTMVRADFQPYGSYVAQNYYPSGVYLPMQQYAAQPPMHFQAHQQQPQQVGSIRSAVQQTAMYYGQPQSVVSNGSVVVNTMAQSVSGPPIGPSTIAASPAAMPAQTAAVVMPPQPHRTITQLKRSRALPIVDPKTFQVVNKEVLEGQQLSASTTTAPDNIEENVKVDAKSKGRNEASDGRSAAQVQHQFQDAILSMAYDKPPQPQVDTTKSATETDGSNKLRASSVPENDSAEAVGDDVDAVRNAIKEKLTFATSKSASSPPESETPVISIESPIENGEKEAEVEEKIPDNTRNIVPTDECNGKEEDAVVVNGTTSPKPETLEAKIQRYETDFSKLTTESKDTDLDAHVYSSRFLHFMRNVVKDLRHINCPKTDSELKDIGIDRAGMPAIMPSVKKYDTGNNRGTFLPSFMQSVNNQSRANQRPNNYCGRSSDNKLRQKKQISGRLSMDRLARSNPPQEVVLSRKSANAWRPSREIRPNDDAEAEKLKYEKLRKEVRGLLNKITPSTYEVLADEFIAKKCCEDQQLMNIVIDLIFDKAVEEPHFCALYSDLCKRQVDVEYQISQGQKTNEKTFSFCHSIIMKCQGTFVASTNSDEQIKALEKELEEESPTTAKRDELKEKIEFLKGKEKRRLNGIIRFIAELYRHSLLINPIINWCAVELVTRYEKTHDDVYIEYAVGMIEKVGASYERRKVQGSQDSDEPIERVFLHLSAIKANLSNRVRFMIMDLEDLRKNNWVPRHGNTGPKTIEEVHNEIANEQLINQQEREAYEKRTREIGGGRKGGGGGGGGGGRSYTGRGSTDNRAFMSNSQTEKRSQAALNSIHTGSSALKKDMDLKKCEDQQKLGSMRAFAWLGGGSHQRPPPSSSAKESSLTRTSTPPSQQQQSAGSETKESSPSMTSSALKSVDAE